MAAGMPAFEGSVSEPSKTKQFAHFSTPRAFVAPVGKFRGKYRVQHLRASDLEYRVYQALLKLGWNDSNIQFQDQILGGHWKPGGLILDFVLYGPDVTTVLQVNGEYWHGGAQAGETQREEEIVRQNMPDAKVYSLNTDDLLTDGVALKTLTKLVGRGGVVTGQTYYQRGKMVPFTGTT